jgi:hypothetical protein
MHGLFVSVLQSNVNYNKGCSKSFNPPYHLPSASVMVFYRVSTGGMGLPKTTPLFQEGMQIVIAESASVNYDLTLKTFRQAQL